MQDKYNRREMLKWLGATLISVVLFPLGLMGCSGDEGNNQKIATTSGNSRTANSGAGTSTQSSGKKTKQEKQTHEIPHPNDAKVPEAEAKGTALGGKERFPGGKSSKDGPSVMYQHEPNGDKYCGNCTMFVPDQDGDGFEACTLVEGKIHRCDFCILYSKHTGEGSIPCKQA